MSTWTRGIVIQLMTLLARRPRFTVQSSLAVDTLFRDPSRKLQAFDWDKRVLSWRNFFLTLDRCVKLYERVPWKPLRERALRQARAWLLDHLERSEGLAAIYPAMMNAIFALVALGHSPDDPLTAREITASARC